MKVLEKGTKKGWKKEETRSKKQWDNSKILWWQLHAKLWECEHIYMDTYVHVSVNFCAVTLWCIITTVL